MQLIKHYLGPHPNSKTPLLSCLLSPIHPAKSNESPPSLKDYAFLFSSCSRHKSSLLRLLSCNLVLLDAVIATLFSEQHDTNLNETWRRPGKVLKRFAAVTERISALFLSRPFTPDSISSVKKHKHETETSVSFRMIPQYSLGR